MRAQKTFASQIFANRVFASLAISVVSGIALQGPAVAQEHQGTFEQQMACTPDVFRLCGQQIPDENRIVACLRSNTTQLSRPCRAVFESNATAPQTPAFAPGRRDEPLRPYRDQPSRTYEDDDQ